MQEKYKFTFDEHVNYQLYIYNKSSNYRRTKLVVRIFGILFFAFGLFLISNKDYIWGFAFATFGISYYLFFPWYIKKINTKHFRNTFGIIGMDNKREFFIEFCDGYMSHKNSQTSSEYKMAHEDIFEIDEVKEAFYVRFNSGIAFIISKRNSDVEKTREHLKNLAESLNVKFVDDSNWVWK